MKYGVDYIQDLFDKLPLGGRHVGRLYSARGLQFPLHFIQELTEELLSILLGIAPKGWDKPPHRVEHGKGGHQGPLPRPHHLEKSVQLVAQGNVFGAGLLGLDKLHAPRT